LREPFLKRIPDARAGKKEGGWGEGIFARPRFPPPNFVPAKLARRL
jgi:hypothetical protein